MLKIFSGALRIGLSPIWAGLSKRTIFDVAVSTEGKTTRYRAVPVAAPGAAPRPVLNLAALGVGDPRETCPLTRLEQHTGLKIAYSDVQILAQFLRPDGSLLPRHLCTPVSLLQYLRVKRAVQQARLAGLLPVPKASPEASPIPGPDPKAPPKKTSFLPPPTEPLPDDPFPGPFVGDGRHWKKRKAVQYAHPLKPTQLTAAVGLREPGLGTDYLDMPLVPRNLPKKGAKGDLRKRYAAGLPYGRLPPPPPQLTLAAQKAQQSSTQQWDIRKRGMPGANVQPRTRYTPHFSPGFPNLSQFRYDPPQ